MPTQRRRKLSTIRALEAEAAALSPPIAYNPGTLSDPVPAVERAMAVFRRRVRGNPLAAYQKGRAVLEELRTLASEVFGGEPSGWAYASGHTSTIDRLAESLAGLLGPGATVVSTRQEHIGGLGAFTRDPRFVVRQMEPEAMPAAAGQIFFLSHLTYDTNRDNEALIRALVARGDAPLVVVDGCQALGQVEVDVGRLGCHAYLASGHKWLGGPHGTGLLYLRRDVIGRWPCPFRAGEPLCPEAPIGRWEPRGGQDFAQIAGLAAAVRAYQCHARPGGELRERFVARLRESLGSAVRVVESGAPEGRAVAFELPGLDVYPVYQRLLEGGVSVKCIKKAGSADGEAHALAVLRIGFPYWADGSDIEEAVALLSRAVEAMAPARAAGSHASAA